MKNWHWLWVVVLAAGLIGGCVLPPGKPKTNAQVYLQLKNKQISDASVLVFNFKEPAYAVGKGTSAAQICQQILLKERLFKTISLNTQFPWMRLADSDEARQLEAVKEGAARGFDYVLVGDLVDYIYGGLNKTKVKFSMRIIETASKQTFFYGENWQEAASKDPSYPLDSQLSNAAESLEKITTELLKELLRMLPERDKKVAKITKSNQSSGQN